MMNRTTTNRKDEVAPRYRHRSFKIGIVCYSAYKDDNYVPSMLVFEENVASCHARDLECLSRHHAGCCVAQVTVSSSLQTTVLLSKYFSPVCFDCLHTQAKSKINHALPCSSVSTISEVGLFGAAAFQARCCCPLPCASRPPRPALLSLSLPLSC